MIIELIFLPFAIIGGIKNGIVKAAFLAVVFSVIIWMSVLLYGMFYSIYIPKSQHVYPVHFYTEQTRCPHGMCHFPVAMVALSKPGYGEPLVVRQRYKIILELEMPESEANQRTGMFTVKLDMLSKDGEVVRSSLRSGVLRYKSLLVRLLYTLLYIPLFLFGSSEEKQVVSVGLFDRYEEEPGRPSMHARVEIRSEFIEIYSASLKIYADFAGLRYFLYYWPLTSAVIGISTNTFFVCAVAVLSWLRLAPGERRTARPSPSEDGSEICSSAVADEAGQPDTVREAAIAEATSAVRRTRRDLEHLDGTARRRALNEPAGATGT